MNIKDSINKFFSGIGLRGNEKTKKKTEVLPWSSIPESDNTMAVYGESAPAWKTEEYLKQAKGWVYSCVSAISDEIATTNFHLYQRKGNEVEEIFEHDLLDLLFKVNDYTTKFDHWWLTQEYLELVGEAPWLLDRSGEDGKPVAMYLLRPDKLSIKFDKDKIIGKYVYEISPQQKEEFEPEQIIFIKYPSPSKPLRGRGTLEAATQTVDLDFYAEKWNVNFFYNAARPDALLTTKGKLTSDQIKRLHHQWKKQFQGIDKVSKLAVLEAGLEYKQLQLSQKDMDFLEQQKFSRDKILSIFRVPKSVIAISDDVNRSNAETGAYAFARWTIKPKMTRIVAQLNEFLVPMFGDDLFLTFDDPVPENVEMKIKEYKEALGPSSWMTVNEVREKEGMSPIHGGDAIYRQVAMVPAGEAGQESKLITMTARRKKVSQHRMIPGGRTPRKGLEEIDEKIEKIIESQLSTKKKGYKKEKPEKKIPKEITDLEGFWKKQIGVEEKYEKKLIVKLKDIFGEQEKQIIKRLEEQSKQALAKGFGKKDYSQQYWVNMKLSIVRTLLNVSKESAKIALATKALFGDSIEEQGQVALDEINVDAQFSRGVAVQGYLKKYPIKFAKEVNERTNERIRKTLTEGVVEGESVYKLSKRITTVFDEARGYRSKTIARTEVSRATGFATEEAYKQSGVVEGKRWLTAFDDRTCQYCALMNGKTVDLGKNYLNKNSTFTGQEGGKIKMSYDSVKHPPLHPNCRCTLIPILEK